MAELILNDLYSGVYSPQDVYECSRCRSRGTDGHEFYYIRSWNNGFYHTQYQARYYCKRCAEALKGCIKFCECCGEYKIVSTNSTSSREKLHNAQYPGIESVCEMCRPTYMAAHTPLLVAACVRCRQIVEWDGDESKCLCQHCQTEVKWCSCCNNTLLEVQGYLVPVCTEEHPTRSEIREQDICYRCFKEQHPPCQECGYYTDKGSKFCPTCVKNVSECSCCHTQGICKPVGDVVGLPSKSKLCSECRSRIGTCSKCNKISLDVGRMYHHHHDRGDVYCTSCIGYPIQNYRFKRPPVFHGVGPLFLGIENEYDWDAANVNWKANTDDLRTWVAKRTDMFHLMHDGSLRHGVELVSQPCSFEHWMSMKKILPPVENDPSLGTAGCHIHMSASAFTNFHLFKYMQFLTTHFMNFSGIFGRGIERYCTQIGSPLQTYARRKNNVDKYWWINMKSGSTVEMRIFKAAADDVDLRTYLQLVHSVYTYTKDKSTKELEDWNAFVRFTRHAPEYALLDEMLEKKPKLEKIKVPKVVKPKQARQRGVQADWAAELARNLNAFVVQPEEFDEDEEDF